VAELLIFARNNTHVDPVKDERGCHKKGDVICVMPDGHTWGNKEVIPPADGGKFVRMTIEDVTPEQIETTLQNRWGLSLTGPEMDPADPDGMTVKRRKAIGFLLDILPAGVRQQLNTTGAYTTDWPTIKSFVRNKLNGETP